MTTANVKRSRSGASTKDKSADPRFQRSLETLIEAVTQLVDRRPLHEISITLVVEKAAVTRPTFYQHFADVPAAAQQAALARLATAFPLPDPAEDRVGLSPQEIEERVERHARPVLDHLHAHRTFYRHVLEEAVSAAFFEKLVAFVSARLLPEVLERAAQRRGASKTDITTVVAGGMTWLVIHWLQAEGEAESAKAMSRRIARVAATIMASGV
ncbi:TetR/AcrR family transcriptional regulator [Enhydrobacter aerosaccus]|nr:TetR-like C-terminal domain-containing protein [Enhydrobacter aerosaccus]